MPETARRLLHVFSTFAVGGQQTRFVSLANALGERYRHTILAMDDNHEAAAALDTRLDCTLVTMPVVKTGGISFSNLYNAWKILRDVRPHCLCTYNWGSIEWSLANHFPRCPQIHLEDGFGPDESPVRQNPRRMLMRRALLSGATRVIVPSSVLYNVATTKWGLPEANVMYLPNGIDTTRFAAGPDLEFLDKLGIRREGLVVGTVAALRAEKNLCRLLRVFAALPPDMEAQLVIVGDGPERKMLSEEIVRRDMADRVIMTGALSQPERVLGRFDVFALSSDTEQMPNSVLEAMAASLPVFTTDVGDVKKMLAETNRPFVFPKDDDVLQVGLVSLLSDSAMRIQIGRDNCERVRSEYGIEKMVSSYDRLFSGCR